MLGLNALLFTGQSDENKFFRLKEEIRRDIIYSIELNLELENITADDSRELVALTNRLYRHICKDVELLGGEEKMKMKPILPGALELPGDKYRMRIYELETENARYADENARYADEITRLKKKIAELETKSMS